MNCNQANKIPIKSVLRSFFLFPSKNSKRGAFYFAVDRKECTPSLHVDYKRNIAHDFGTGKNYDNVSLVQTINRCSITEALEYLSSFSFHNFSKRIAVERKKENWRIREIKSVQHPALINYIKKRRVFEQSQFLKEIHYTVNDKSYFGLGFENDSGGWEIRNKYAKICLEKKDITLIKSNNDVLRIFEGFFDFLSFLEIRKSLEMKTSDYLILNSVALVEQAENTLSSYLKIELYLDNDQAGDKATGTLKNACKNIEDNRLLYRNFKDLNEYLMASKGQKNKV